MSTRHQGYNNEEKKYPRHHFWKKTNSKSSWVYVHAHVLINIYKWHYDSSIPNGLCKEEIYMNKYMWKYCTLCPLHNAYWEIKNEGKLLNFLKSEVTKLNWPHNLFFVAGLLSLVSSIIPKKQLGNTETVFIW